MTRFLLDEDLPRSAGPLARRCGFESVDVREVGLRGKKDALIASYALEHRLCILTGDFDFSDIRNYPPRLYHGIVVFWIPSNASATYILGLIEGFLNNRSISEEMEGKLAIVEPTRIRIRSDG